MAQGLTNPKLQANSGVDIGDVDVASIIPGVGATNLGKAEDAAHTTGDIGVMILTKRTDTAATSAGTDGDYATLNTDNTGRLWVRVANTDTITPGTGATNLGKAVDSAAGSTDTGTAGLAIRDDTLTTLTPVDGDYTNLRTNSRGAQWVVHDGNITAAGDVGVIDQLDLTNSNPLAVAIVDANGDQLASIGGGTQYTEDAAAAANPIGNAMIVVREDARAGSLTSADGDNVALRGNNLGELYVKHTDSIAVTNGGLTELAAAINGSSQLDINIAASAATLTVASHAVTNAGTFAVQVDGAALTALQLIDDPVATLGTTTYTEASTKGMIIGAVRRDADTTLVDTTNEVGPLQMDANGRLKVEAFSGETLPVSLASVPSHAVTNAGTFVVQESGSALTALQLIDDMIVADDAAFTVGTTKTSVAGFLADETSPDSVNEGDAGAARITLDRMQIVTVRPNATGEGLDIFRTLDADETEEEIKATAGKIYGWFMYNDGASEVYVKFYNATAANVTVGTTTPVLTVPLPASSAANIEFTNGIPFSTAICIAATTGVADADTAAPAANQVVANIFYK